MDRSPASALDTLVASGTLALYSRKQNRTLDNGVCSIPLYLLPSLWVRQVGRG